MGFRRIVFVLPLCVVFAVQRPGQAQPSDSAAAPPSTDTAAAEPAQPTEQVVDVQSELRIEEARRLWQIVQDQRRSGKWEEARASYVRYLEAAYAANQNPWLLLELGRSQEQLGRMEPALAAYKSYLMSALPNIAERAERAEAERAVKRLESRLNPLPPVQQSDDQERPRVALRLGAPTNPRKKGLGLLIGGISGLDGWCFLAKIRSP